MYLVQGCMKWANYNYSREGRRSKYKAQQIRPDRMGTYRPRRKQLTKVWRGCARIQKGPLSQPLCRSLKIPQSSTPITDLTDAGISRPNYGTE